MRDTQDSKGGPLDEMPDSWERELLESIFSGRIRHQVKEWGCLPIVKSSDPELFLLKRIAGTERERKMKEGRFSDRTKLGSNLGEALRPDTVTDAVVCLQTGTYYGCSLRGPTDR